jgi:hypothetical protein
VGVTLVLQTPIFNELSPKWHYQNLLKAGDSNIKSKSVKIDHTSLLELQGLLSNTSTEYEVLVINPFDYLCSDKFCDFKDDDGRFSQG